MALTLIRQALCLALAIVFCGKTAAAADDEGIVTDRPDITESSVVVPKGSLQGENGVTWSNDHGTRSFDASESLLRFGMTDKTEFRLALPIYALPGARTGLPSGFSDLSVGFKRQLGPLPGGFELSVIGAVSLPTGAARISSHGYDPFVKFPWSKELKNGWQVGGMQSIFWNTDGNRRSMTWEPTFYLEKQITKPWDAFVEYGGDYIQHAGPQQIAHFGMAYKLTPHNQIDMHFGFGMNRSTPSHFFALGYSFRVDRLWARN